jgi:hypothetical protein
MLAASLALRAQPAHVVDQSTPPPSTTPVPAGKALGKLDPSKLPPSTAKTNNGQGLAKGTTKPKGKPVDVSGTWTWSSPNRNGQMLESTLTVSVDKKGVITGTLSDSFGQHPIVNPSLDADVLTFTIMYPAPGRSDVPVTYTVTLDSNDLKVSVDEPDPTPAGKSNKKKVHKEFAAKHGA